MNSPRVGRLVVAVVGLLLGSALAALPGAADPIGPDCGTCQGSIYTLTYDGTPVATDVINGTETWRITLTIDTSGYDGGGTLLNAVSIKVSSMLESETLVSAPFVVGGWTEWMGGLNANGCSGSGGGFDCAYAGSTGVAVPNGTYEWVFDLEMNDDPGTLFTGANLSTIKVRYVDDNGVKVGDLVSENLTLQLIPEPATGALVGVGTAALALRGRRRFEG